MNRLFREEIDDSGLRLDVLLLREKGGEKEYWVAQCLQYDICVQASTIERLREAFMNVLVGNIILAIQREEEPFSRLKPAPEKYWDLHRTAMRFDQEFPVTIPGNRIPRKSTPSRIPRATAFMALDQNA